MQAEIPILGPITVDLPPGHEARPNPQMRGVLYFDEQGRQVGAAMGDDNHTRRLIWVQYNRRQDRPAVEPPPESPAVSAAPPERRSQRKRVAK